MANKVSTRRGEAAAHSKKYAKQLEFMRKDIARALKPGAALQVAKDLRKAGVHVGWKNADAPDLPDSLDLVRWAKHRQWWVYAVASWLTEQSKRDQRKGRKRFDFAATIVTSKGVVSFGDGWGSVVEKRKRWMRDRFSRLPKSAAMAGYIDVSLNRDLNHAWTWSLHEHVIVSLTAKSEKAAKAKVRAAFAPRKYQRRDIKRAVRVCPSDYPVGYLAYATRTVHPFTVKTREAVIPGGKRGPSKHYLRGKQRHELVRNMSLIRPQDRIILGGLTQEGRTLKRTRRGKK